MTVSKTTGLWTALTFVLLGCSPPSEPASPSLPDQAEDSPEVTNRIGIPPTVQKNLGITFATVEARRVAQTIRVPGSFELQPRARREYRMALPGRVELLVDQLQTVSVGQALFRFQSPAWPELLHEIILAEQTIETANSEIAVGKARLEEARRKLGLLQTRIEALAQADFKRADLETAAAELEASLLRLEAEVRLGETRLRNAERSHEHALHRASSASSIPESKLNEEVSVDGFTVPTYATIDWIEVRATRPGIVELLSVTDGAFVEPPSTVLTTVDPTKVRFRALALQADLARISGSTECRIVPPRSPGIPISAATTAEMRLGLEAHPEERTISLLATPHESLPWIRPGISAFLEIEVDSSASQALAIPRSAIVKDGLHHVFFRRDPKDPSTAIRVEADLGVSDGRWVAIQSGLVLGDEVVLSGAYELKLATERSGGSQAGGHFHADGSFHGEH